MQYVPLGRTGLLVSRIALGCMGFADPARGVNPWALDDRAAAPVFRRAVEAGITLWDTANVYGGGTSEEIVGRAVRRYTRREDVVIATKVGLPMHGGPGRGLSRRAVLSQVEGSLTRLGTDYIDLYQIHRFDPATPVEETMEALHDVVAAGKVRYVGASSMWAWQFAKMQHAAAQRGHTGFVSMQNQYNLVQREEEREMFPLLADQGVASLPWCPLAKGYLARPYGRMTERSSHDPVGQRAFGDADRPIVEAVERVAAGRGISMAQAALAWVLNHPAVAAPVVGATRPEHIDDAVAALAVRLDPAEIQELESPYTPRRPTGF